MKKSEMETFLCSENFCVSIYGLIKTRGLLISINYDIHTCFFVCCLVLYRRINEIKLCFRFQTIMKKIESMIWALLTKKLGTLFLARIWFRLKHLRVEATSWVKLYLYNRYTFLSWTLLFPLERTYFMDGPKYILSAWILPRYCTLPHR